MSVHGKKNENIFSEKTLLSKAIIISIIVNFLRAITMVQDVVLFNKSCCERFDHRDRTIKLLSAQKLEIAIVLS